jgi:hypothetical protein
MHTGIYIGTATAKDIKALAASITSIISVPHCDEATKQAALKVLETGVQPPTHNSVTNCTFTGSNPKNSRKKK